MMKKLLLLGAYLSFFTLAAAPKPFAVTEKGGPKVEILIEENAPPAVQFAATELQRIVRKISGATLWIHQHDLYKWKTNKIVPAMPDSVFLGQNLKAHFAKDFAALKGTDGYAVRQFGNMLFVLADCPKGILNGIYRMLMRNTDIIWPRPAGALEMVTPTEDLALTAIDYIEIPKFKIHGFGWNYSRALHSPELDLWKARMGDSLSGPEHEALKYRRRQLGFYEGYFNEFGGGHNLVSRWITLDRFGKSNPEFYMQVEGKRRLVRDANLCFMNTDCADALAKRVLETIPTLPKAYTMVNLMMEDQSVCCECPLCTKPIKLADGSIVQPDDEAFRSTQHFMFLNRVAKKVAEKYPDIKLKSYAYFFAAVPPRVKLEPNLVVHFCPYIRNDKEPLSGPSNARWKKRTDGWLANTPNVIWREYYYSGARFPRPLGDIVAQDLRYLHKKGLFFVTSEFTWSDDDHMPGDKMPASEFWDTTATEAWTLQQLLWDPYLNPQELRREYLKRTYGPAAPALKKYYDIIRDAWLKDPAPSVFNDDVFKSAAHYIVRKNNTDACRAALVEAEAKADNPVRKNLIRANRKVFEKWIERAAADKGISLRIPLLKVKDFPSFDPTDGVWSKAADFPELPIMGDRNRKGWAPQTNKIFHDGRSFYILCRTEKPAATFWTRQPAGARRDMFPSGDHVELFFAHPKYGYVHLAYDLHGNTYDAKQTDPIFNPAWTVKVKQDAASWTGVAQIPFAALDFEMLKSNKLRMLLYSATMDAKRKAEHRTWGAGKVHAADGFGELVCDIE